MIVDIVDGEVISHQEVDVHYVLWIQYIDNMRGVTDFL